MGVDIDKALLASCQAADIRHLSTNRRDRLSSVESLKRKSMVTEMDDLKAKRRHLEADIGELNKCADNLSTN